MKLLATALLLAVAAAAPVRNPAFRSQRTAPVTGCSGTRLKTLYTATAVHRRIAPNQATCNKIDQVFKKHYMEPENTLLKTCGQAFDTPARMSDAEKRNALVKMLLDHSIGEALFGETRTKITGTTALGAWTDNACEKTSLLACIKDTCEGNFHALMRGHPDFRAMNCPTV